MSEPPPRRARGALNFTALQFVLFGGAALIGLAALLAAGLAFGLAVAGAGCFAVLVLAIWLIAANILNGERVTRRPPPA